LKIFKSALALQSLARSAVRTLKFVQMFRFVNIRGFSVEEKAQTLWNAPLCSVSARCEADFAPRRGARDDGSVIIERTC